MAWRLKSPALSFGRAWRRHSHERRRAIAGDDKTRILQKIIVCAPLKSWTNRRAGALLACRKGIGATPRLQRKRCVPEETVALAQVLERGLWAAASG